MPHPLILDRFDVVASIDPINLATGANAGRWVNLKNARRALVLLIAGIGANGESPTIHIDQATSIAGAGSKDGPDLASFFTKNAVDISTIDTWTKTVLGAADEDFTIANVGDQMKLWAVEIDPQALDFGNGFTCIKASVPDVGATSQLGTLIYLLEKRVETAPNRQQAFQA